MVIETGKKYRLKNCNASKIPNDDVPFIVQLINNNGSLVDAYILEHCNYSNQSFKHYSSKEYGTFFIIDIHNYKGTYYILADVL